MTFAFTDIEGSTLRWERNSEAMQDAVRRHDAIFRAAIAEHDGYVFKTMGDAFCAAFARPEKAVAAMLDVQRALAVADFSAVDGLLVRAAIHTGTADEREGDYFGSAVNRVARLLAIGHGGQILVSGVASDIVQGSLPPQASLRSLGEHRLRDLSRPEQVYQLLAPGIAADFPTLRSLNELPNNLPQQLKSFIGREQQIAEITSLIQEHRLVTLVGSAGVGKTRTSLQVAANLLDCSADGVWFIELAPLSTGEFIPGTLSRVLGIRLPLDGDPFANIARALKSKELTLVLDNCEHLIEPAAHLVSMVLRDCPKVRVLATSRQGLGIEGEQMYRTQSLDIAREDATVQITAQVALRCEAIALFVDRALAADKRFALTDQNAQSRSRHLRASRRNTACHRTRGLSREHTEPAPTTRATRRALQGTHRRQPRCIASSADAARSHQLEPRPPQRVRADSLSASWSFWRRVHARGSHGHRERRGTR